ncbi:MAG: MarR family transcriptional regulator [Aliishimia sp.]
MEENLYIRDLINRLARLDATSTWRGGLNPAQMSVLSYLSRANRFSRSPSQVAEYLGSTRGTVSQTFKALAQKGYVTGQGSQTDRRTISFDLTKKGVHAVAEENLLIAEISKMDKSAKKKLMEALAAVTRSMLKENGGRAFGICNQCRHFSARENGGHCALLLEDLTISETLKICHEQEAA